MTLRTTTPLRAAFIAATLLAACADDPAEPTTPSTIEVTPASVSLQSLDETVQLTAAVKDQNGQAMPDITVAWASSDPAVGTVDDSGLVTAVANGTVTVTATAWSASGSAAVTVDQIPAEVVVEPATDTLLASGYTRRLSAEVRDANGNPVAGPGFTWASTDTLVAVVDEQGVVTGVSAGEVEITATSEGLTGRARLTVVAQEPTKVTVSPDTVALLFLGHTQRLAAEVRDQAGGVILGAVVSWSSGDPLVATVDSAGLVTATGGGTTTVAATAGSATATAVVAVTLLDERGALAAIYRSTGGDAWRSSENWLSDKPLGQWHGVEVDDQGRVIGLELRNNELVGEIPPEIKVLASLEVLDLSGNDLSGPIPPWLGDLANLQVLNLSRSGFWGLIPPELEVLASLEVLDLGGNRLSGPIPPWLGDLANLEVLDLYRSDHVGRIPAELGDLANLRVLSLGWNNLSGSIPAELGDLANLEELRLLLNDLSGPIPPELGDLANLEQLDLRWNGLSGPIPPELGDLANLERLGLHRNGLLGPIPPELGDLANLRGLGLGENDLSGSIPPELADLANLEQLYLAGNDLSGPIPPELGDLANLQQLYLAGNDLSGPIPPELGNLAKLEVLALDGSGFSGPIPPEMGNLAKLRELVLSHTSLSGPIPPSFGKLTELEEIVLAESGQLAGALPEGLTNLPLQVLNTGGTDLCVPSDRAFQAWLTTIPRVWVASCDRASAYLVQAIQSRAHPMPLVAGESALLRVFVTAKRSTSEVIPPVRARFYLDGTERHAVEIPVGTGPIPLDVDEGALWKSANTEIPDHVVEPGLEMVVEIDPDQTLDTALGVPKRIPETGRMAVDVRKMPTMNITAIPFLWSSGPDSAIVYAVEGMEADPEGHPLLEHTRILLPVGDIDVTAHEPVVSTSYNGFDLLAQTEALRVLEGGRGHYMGMRSGRYSNPGPNGVAYVPGRSSFSVPLSDVIAHELGHNMGLLHAPCGDAGGIDPWFPDPDGGIKAWGYDSRGDSLVSPARPDLMSYCGPEWISGYHFANALGHRLRDEAASARAPTVAPTTSLLLWGGVDPDGSPFLNPAFVAEAPAALPDSAGDHTLTGRDAAGGELFSLSFAMTEIADGDGQSGFVFVLPAADGWAGDLASVTLAGPDGSVTLDRATDAPMAILRNPVTGRIRGFLRDLPQETQAAMDAAGRAVEPGLEVLFSRGIPAASEWRR